MTMTQDQNQLLNIDLIAPLFPPLETIPQSQREEWYGYILSDDFQGYLMALYGLHSLLLSPERKQVTHPAELASVDSKIEEAIEYRSQVIEILQNIHNNNTGVAGETGYGLKSCLKREGAPRRAKLSVTFDPVEDIRIIPARPNATSRRRLPKRCLKKLRRHRRKVRSDEPCSTSEFAQTSPSSEISTSYKVTVAVWSDDNNTNKIPTDSINTSARPPSPPPAWRDETFSYSPPPAWRDETFAYSPPTTVPEEHVQSGISINNNNNNKNNKNTMPDIKLDEPTSAAAAANTIHPSQPKRHHFRFWLNHKSPQAPSVDHASAVPCSSTSASDPYPHSRSGLQESECQGPATGRHRRRLKMWLKLR